MNKSKLVKFIEQQMTISSDFVAYNEEIEEENSRMFWLGRWGILSELLRMIERGDFDDIHSN